MGIDPAAGVIGGAVGAFLTTLVVGGIMLAVAPAYIERMRTIVLAITTMGTLLALPLALVAYVVWAVGSAIAYLAIGDRLVGHENGWLKPLLVGAGINGALSSFAPRSS